MNYKYYILSLLFLITFLIPAIAQKNEVNTDGYNRFYYGNGQISSEGFMKAGKPYGYWKTYYPSGILKSEGNRKNFELDSVWVFYDEDGDSSKIINYRNGLKSGFYLTYIYEKDAETKLKSGGLVSKELYLSDQKQGNSYYYNKQTKSLQSITPFKDNKKDGLSKEFSEDGRLITLVDYRNDVLINREYINRFNRENLKQGIWKEFYPDDNLKSEANYVNGKIHGLYKEYSGSGELIKAVKYEYGELVQEANQDTASHINSNLNALLKEKIREEYHENGKIKYMGVFNDSVPVGEHKIYSSDGKNIEAKVYDDYGNITSKGFYNVGGQRSGKWVYFYNSGKIMSEGSYVNGKRHGTWNFYFEDGKKEQEGNYINGKTDGLWKWYYSNGQLEREENYEEGKEQGFSAEYDEKGNVLEKGEYADGLREGLWFYNVGDHTEEGNYHQDMEEGLWKYHYENGKLFFEGKFVQSEPDGKHIYYWDNGRSKMEGKYILGSREGNWYFYDYEGELTYTIKFKDDVENRINGKKINLDK